jgi:hypothetical protein
MKPNQTLINALRTVAGAIEDGQYWDEQEQDYVPWDWDVSCRCNVGLLLRELGANEDQIQRSGVTGFWFKAVERVNTPFLSFKTPNLDYILSVLQRYGVEPSDIEEIEFCGGQVEAIRPSDSEGNTDNSREVAKKAAQWMRDKANLLEHQLANESKASHPVVAVKSVD